MADNKLPSVDSVVDSMFNPTPATGATPSVTQTRPTMECTATYADDGSILLRIPPATPDKVTLSLKGKPMLTLKIPELQVTLQRGEQRAVKVGQVPYGTVTVMVKL